MIHLQAIKQNHKNIHSVRKTKKRSARLFLKLPNLDKIQLGMRLQIAVFLVITLALTFGLSTINSNSSIDTKADTNEPRIITNFNQNTVNKSTGFLAEFIKEK